MKLERQDSMGHSVWFNDELTVIVTCYGIEIAGKTTRLSVAESAALRSALQEAEERLPVIKKNTGT